MADGYEGRLRADDYTVEGVSMALCHELVRREHYAQGGSNTATFRHGLYPKDNPLLCVGVAWWIPPTKDSAIKTLADAGMPDGDWHRVLALSRLVVAPGVPKNAAGFLIARSIRLIKQAGGWDCLVTYADEYQGHSGGIYKATNWIEVGLTDPYPVYVDRDGRMVARKRGPRTYTHDEMLGRGYTLLGRFAKRKFVYPLVKTAAGTLKEAA